MPKTNPYYIPKENIIKTEEVRYLNTEIPSYEEFMKTYDYDEALMASYEAEYEALRQIYGYGPGFGEWLLKVAIVTVAGPILGPAAIPIGAAVWGTSELIVNNTDDESLKTVFGHVSDVGKGTFTGGCLGVAAKGVGAVAGFNKAAGLGKNCVGSFNSAVHGIKVAGTIEFWTGKGFEAKDALSHLDHKQNGIEYKVGCKVCES